MYYHLGDKVVLKNLDEPFKVYNDKEFVIEEIYKFKVFLVKRDGFDPIWVNENNFKNGDE